MERDRDITTLYLLHETAFYSMTLIMPLIAWLKGRQDAI